MNQNVELDNMSNLPMPPHRSQPYRIISMDFPINPDFTFIDDKLSRNMIEKGYRSVMRSEGWKILSEFTGQSFMFSNEPNVCRIMKAVSDDYDGHSGSSMGYTMRQLERISHVGFNTFKQNWLTET